MKKAMIVAAHPDDAELSMGGTIAKMIQAGWSVVLVDLTDGEPTPFGSKQLRQKETDACAFRCPTVTCRPPSITEENWRRLSD
jgi:LmbE family N-acetylglucosaminyl deacetylase